MENDKWDKKKRLSRHKLTPERFNKWKRIWWTTPKRQKHNHKQKQMTAVTRNNHIKMQNIDERPQHDYREMRSSGRWYKQLLVTDIMSYKNVSRCLFVSHLLNRINIVTINNVHSLLFASLKLCQAPLVHSEVSKLDSVWEKKQSTAGNIKMKNS